jgi:hypothetical protein
MFCQKCGHQNSSDGKFCRGCGAQLTAAAVPAVSGVGLRDSKGKPVTLERVFSQIGTGVAFLAIAIVLGTTGYAGGRNWWFWLLIPAFTMISAGLAKYIQLRKQESVGYVGGVSPQPLSPNHEHTLPAAHTTWAPAPESRYKTGGLVPPSVTDNTTRHLEIDSEGRTMALPKK